MIPRSTRLWTTTHWSVPLAPIGSDDRMHVQDDRTYEARTLYDDGSEHPAVDARWTSSDARVVRVVATTDSFASCKVEAIAEGTAELRCEGPLGCTKVTITVREAPDLSGFSYY